jgi:hypothetical protein
MSNLNLPNLSYKSLSDMAIQPGETRKLAYETTVETMGDVFVIRHHGNAIAEVGLWSLDITDCGWGSSTTRTRLNKVVRDNVTDIPVHLNQKNYQQVLTWFKSTFPFRWASFRMDAGVWTLTSVTA